MGRYSLAPEKKKSRYTLTEGDQNNETPDVPSFTDQKEKPKKPAYDEAFYNKHPVIKSIGESLSKMPGLTRAGNIAGHINRVIEGTGLPSLVQGAMQGAESGIRNTYNLGESLGLIRGLKGGPKFPETNFQEIAPIEQVNPQLQDILHGVGYVGGELETGGGIKNAFTSAENLIPKLPDYAKNLYNSATHLKDLPKDIYHAIPSFPKREVTKVREGIENAMKETEKAQAAQSALQEEVHGKHGASTPKSLQFKLNVAPKEYKAPTTIVPEEAPVSINPFEERTEARTAASKAEEALAKATSSKEAATEKVAGYEAALRKGLGEGKTHDVELTRKVKPALKKNQEEIGAGYKEQEAELAKKEVKITTTEEVKKAMKEADTFHGLLGYKPTKEAAAEFETVSKEHVIPADVFSRNIRSIRHSAKEANQKAYQVGHISDNERLKYEGIADGLNAQADVLEAHLIKNIGNKHKLMREGLNHRWATEVRSLDKNPTFRKIQKQEGISGDDLAMALRGDAEGQQHLRNTILKDPDAVLNLLGHKYAQNPSGLVKVNEETQQYVNALPKKVKVLRENLVKAVAERDAAHAAHAKAKRGHAEAKSAAAKENSVQKQLKASHEEKVKQENKREADRQANIEARKKDEEINRHNKMVTEKMKSIESDMKDVKKAMENTRLNKEEHMRLNLRLKELTKNKERLKKLGAVVLTIGTAVTGYKGIRSAFKAITK